GRDRQEPHRGIEPRCDCLTLFLLVFQLPGLVCPGPVTPGPAPVRFLLEPVPPLASFFCFRSRTLMFFFFLSCMFVTCPLLDLCGTEQQLMLARSVLFWNQVIQTNQFIFPALGPLIS